MATRMQQRRGTAQQWTDADPILAAGEIGFETDTNQFKIGDGVNAWSDLSYFKNLEDLGGTLDDYVPLTQRAAANGVATLDGTGKIPVAQLGNIIDGAPAALDTLNEIATMLGDGSTLGATVVAAISNLDDAIGVVQTNLNTHEADTTNVHGIGDTAELATLTSVSGSISTAVSTHTADTTDIHGIADTALLATKNYADSAVSTHGSDTTSVHGIADTAALATKTYADDAVSTHNSDTTNVHGIADTAALATQSYADTASSSAVSTHNAVTTNVHGIADTALLATKAYADTAEADAITAAGTAADGKISTAVAALTKSSVGLANVDNTADADKPVSTATQTALDLKAPLAAPSFTGNANFESNVTIEGNLTVEGTTTTVNTSEVQINDPLFYLAANQYDTNTRDIGITGAYGTVGGTEANHLHTGLVKDVTDGKWKLFSNTPHPVNNVVDFTSADYDTLKVGSLEATTVTPSSGVVFSDGTQTKEGVASRTPIIQKTASYTLSALTERDSMIEVSSGSATTVTIPANSSVAYPIGTSIDVLQTSTGQVTIAAGAGVTVNATPGLKLRTQWSSATLFKRAENTWVVYGDLTA
jgi:hypothetical protein